ncbi:MAG: SDR family oxidoreductase [Haliscomenobacter sp.]|nr:SDR family oxidoreductase [Haliscomenobacter sp.]
MNRIILTGASRGIGYETVLALAADPRRRILALSRNLSRLGELQQEARRRHPDSQVFIGEIDLERPLPPSFQDLVEQTLGGADVLIHNAGLLLNKPFLELERTEWERIFQANLFGAAELSRRLFPFFQRNTQSHIVHLGSMGGFQGSGKFPGLSAYSASKAALACLAECLAEEWKDTGIAVNCLALGAVQTEMLEQAFPGYQAPVSSSDMGAFVADFALNGWRFFNGKILPVSLSTP